MIITINLRLSPVIFLLASHNFFANLESFASLLHSFGSNKQPDKIERHFDSSEFKLPFSLSLPTCIVAR